MVSENIIVILLIIAIVLSVVSITLTISLNTDMLQVNSEAGVSDSQGNVKLVVEGTSGGGANEGS